jgi:signal peptidase II
MLNFRRGVFVCLLLAGTAGCDRVTKHFAVTALAGAPHQSYLADTIRLQYHENPGAFLSAGARWPPLARAAMFQFGNALFLAFAGFLAARYRWNRLARYGLLLFLAGGLSNLTDRIVIGSVIDFLNIGLGPVRTGIFNVADVAIMAGVTMVLWEVLQESFARHSYTSTMSTIRN